MCNNIMEAIYINVFTIFDTGTKGILFNLYSCTMLNCSRTFLLVIVVLNMLSTLIHAFCPESKKNITGIPTTVPKSPIIKKSIILI